jgi:transposase
MRPHGTIAQLEARRRKAVALLAEGDTVTAVAKQVGASHSSVLRWRDAVAAKGEAGLLAKPASGRPSRLSARQHQQLLKILGRGARRSGFATELWTCARVAQVIEMRFGVAYHSDYVGTLLHKLGWSPQKPERRARERDEDSIATWRRETWPRLKKEARTKS